MKRIGIVGHAEGKFNAVTHGAALDRLTGIIVDNQPCVVAMGGKCLFYGYNKCVSALIFHHLDPSKKEGNRVKEARREEMDYSLFILLCANCHRELHASLRLMPSILPQIAPDAGMVSYAVRAEKE